MPKSNRKPPPRPKRGAQPSNANAVQHGFYSDRFTEDELARVAEYVQNPNLADELWMLRVLNRRLLAHVADTDEPAALDDLIRANQALAETAGRIASLLRVQRTLSGDGADSLAGAIGKVLDEISAEMGIEL